MDTITTIYLLISFIIAGLLCGVMFNIALGRKFYESGALLGGIVVGLLMFLL